MTTRSFQGAAGIVEVPELSPDDPLSAELDEAYWLLARGEVGADEAIRAVEAKIVAREAVNRRQVELERRAAAHQQRLDEAQKAVEHAEARRRVQAAEVTLRPLRVQLEGLAGEFARTANRLIAIGLMEQNRSLHPEVLEVLRTQIFKNSAGVIRRRLLEAMGMPAASNRQIIESPSSAVIESE